ncbi:TonB-dependent receptor [Pseudomonas sp. HLT2-19-2]
MCRPISPVSTCPDLPASRKSPGVPSGHLLLALASSMALYQMPGAALAEELTLVQSQARQQHFDIPAGPLAPALRNLSSHADLLLSFTAKQTEGKVTQGVRGQYTAPQALSLLLGGTGLQGVQLQAGGYVLRLSLVEDSDSASHMELPSMTISGKASDYQASVPVSSATRSDADSLDVPQTVDTVPAAVLRDRAARSVKEALAYTPGVTSSTGEGIREQFVIRGFSAISDTYVDGMRDGGSTFRDTFNLEQIEVVKGPSGVLYGRGSAGGLINLVSKRPHQQAQADIAASLGSNDARRVTLDVNQPLHDAVQLRMNAMADEGNSNRDDVWYKKNGLALASTLKFNEDVSLDLRAQHLADKRVFDAGIPGINGKPADVSRSTYYGSMDPGNNDSGTSEDISFQADLKVALSDTLQLRNTLSYRTLDLERNQTTINRLLLNTPTPTLRLSRSNFDSEQTDLANKLELTKHLHWLGIEHELMVGAEYAIEQRDMLSRGGDLPAAYNLAVYNPVLKTVPYSASSVRRDGIYDTHTAGYYIQNLMRFNEHWVMLLGVREDKLDRDFANRIGSDYGRKDDYRSPRAGIVYQPNGWSSYYVSASRSYQPGSATGVIDPGNAIQPAEITTSYEVGSKFSLNDGALELGVSLFQIIKENVPTRDPSDPSGPSLYVGEITAEGVELSALGGLGYGVSLQGGITYLDAQVTKSNNTMAPAITPTQPATPLEGKRAAHAPRLSASLWGVKELDNGWRAGIGVRHQADSYASTTNAITLPAYTVLDAGLFYEYRPWAFALNARNLSNKTYYESATNDLGILPGEPRSLQFTTSYLY